MFSSRLFLPLLFAFTLLFAQQGGISHALRHVLAEQKQQDKQAPHPTTCDQCASYAQLGGALNSAFHSFAVTTLSSTTVQQRTVIFNSIHVIAATARGPPALHKVA